jgi:hypothetical protein
VQKIIVSNSRDQQQLKTLAAKVKELETTCAGLRSDMTALNLKELHDKLAELPQVLEKKASILDLKKLYSSLEDSSTRYDDTKKDIAALRQSIKALEENEEVKSLQLKVTSMDNKLIIGLKSIKDLQTKMAETMTLQIMPQTQMGNDDEKREEKFNAFMDEVNDKIAKVKDMIGQVKAEFGQLTKDVDEKVELKASKESLIDLESITQIRLDRQNLP